MYVIWIKNNSSMYYENPDYIYECYIEKNNLKIKRLEELKKK